jgi:ribose transport system substrate-binding protein
VAGDTCTAEGTLLAQWVIADSAGKANVVFFGTQTYACNIQRQAGFEAGMKACTTCTEKSIEFAIAAVATTLPSQIGAALTASQNTNYVVGTFDAVSLAATDQIRQSGKSIKVGGFDANAPNLALIAKSDIQVADVTTGSEDAGWAAVDAALRAVAGQKLPASTAVSTVLITPSNIAGIGQVFKGATGYQDAFKKLWGLS